MKATITVTSAQLIKLLKEKYPDLEIDWIWFDLNDTKEHWEALEGKKLTSERLTAYPLKKLFVRIWEDGSFDLPANVKYENEV